jgi:hypothetical protein
MLRLIEKIVDEILDNEFYTFGLGSLIVILCTFGLVTYKEKLDTEVKLAKIAAGQFECESKGECKCKCK